jgi:hypothetical protein
MSLKTSIAVKLNADELSVSHEEVARYAGGTRYQKTAPQGQFIQPALEQASRLVAPAFAFNLYDVDDTIPEWARVFNGAVFSLPAGKPDTEIKHIAFCVCTIGSELDKIAQELMITGRGRDGLFLDAAGNAYLDAVVQEAHRLLSNLAAQRHLHSNCGIRPGCSRVDISVHDQLFNLVDASLIGVNLNENCVMVPAKSLSFFMQWTNEKMLEDVCACDMCGLKKCLYRKRF